MGKSECWVVKWSWSNEDFEGKKRRGRPRVPNKAAKIVLKKARYKIGDSTRKLSHKQAKSSAGSWKANEYLKLEAPEMVKLKKKVYLICQLTLSSYQISGEVQKPCCRRGPGWLSFVDECPKYIYFFQLPKVNKYCLGVQLASAHQVMKKLKIDHLWVYTPCPTPCRNGYRMW